MSNEYRDWQADEIQELKARIAELEAENARLREALLTIRDINVFDDDIT